MSTRSGHKRVRSCERYFSMLRKFTGLVAVGLIAASGCNSGTPGGPGAADSSAKKPLYGEAKDTFNLSVPALSTSLKQGDSKEATISIKRGKNFDQDVTLTFAELPKGVTVEPASPVIKHGDAEVKFTFKAVDAATLGDFTVKLTGHPTKGSDALHDFKLTLVHKDTFTLSAPVLSTNQFAEAYPLTASTTLPRVRPASTNASASRPSANGKVRLWRGPSAPPTEARGTTATWSVTLPPSPVNFTALDSRL